MPRVYLTRSARQTLHELDARLANAVLEALQGLRANSESGHPLRGRLQGLRSLRVGAYRLIYELRDDGSLRVLAIRHRASAYRTDPR